MRPASSPCLLLLLALIVSSTQSRGWAASPAPAVGVPNGALAPVPVVAAKPSGTAGWTDGWTDGEKYLGELVLALFAAGPAAMAGAWVQRRFGPKIAAAHPHDRELVVLIAGAGGVGKTTLSNALLDRPLRNDPLATKNVKFEAAVVTLYDQQVRVRVPDYEGQQIGTLMSLFFAQKALPIGVVVMMIQIKTLPPATSGAADALPDLADLGGQAQLWSADLTLDVIFNGLMKRPQDLSAVVLFVNKAEAIPMSLASRREIDLAVAPLRTALERRAAANGAELRVIVGSAKTGSGLIELKQIVYDAALLASETEREHSPTPAAV